MKSVFRITVYRTAYPMIDKVLTHGKRFTDDG